MIAADRLVAVAAALEAELSREFGAEFVDKEDSPLHRSIAGALDVADGAVGAAAELASFVSLDPPALRLPSGREYLEDFGTTIGDTVALPRAWRRDAARVITRLLVGPHEVVHVDQHRKGVDAGWWPKLVSHSVLYLCSVATDDAAEYLGKVEADAYATTECVRAWLNGGTRRPIAGIVASLRAHYAIRPAGADVAEATMRSHYATMDDGGIPNVRVCRFAIDWLESHAADCKDQVPA